MSGRVGVKGTAHVYMHLRGTYEGCIQLSVNTQQQLHTPHTCVHVVGSLYRHTWLAYGCHCASIWAQIPLHFFFYMHPLINDQVSKISPPMGPQR